MAGTSWIPTPTPLGTAPRRISPGVWRTRTGMTLSPAASVIWEGYFHRGRTDGRGHMTVPSVVVKQPRPPQPQTPTVKPGHGVEAPHVSLADKLTGHMTPAQKRQAAAWNSIQQTHYNPKTRQSSVADAKLEAQNPHLLLDKFVEAVNPVGDIVHGLQHGDVGKAVLGAAMLPLPFGKAAKAAKAAIEAEKAAQAVKAAEAPLTIEQKVLRAMPAGERKYQEEAAVRSAEKSARLAAGDAARIKAGGGLAGHHAAMGALHGEYTKTPFHELSSLSEDELNHLADSAYNNPDLTGFQKRKAVASLEKVWGGRAPNPSDVAAIRSAFGDDAAVALAATEPVHVSVWNRLADVLNIPRAVRSIGDLSEFFRQTIMLMANDPKLVLGKIPTAFHMAASPGFYEWSNAQIKATPTYAKKLASGLELPRRDERLMSDLAAKIPILKYLVNASNRGFTGPINLMRSEKWDKLYYARGLDAMPEGPEKQKAMESISRFVNWSTGRGDIGRLGGDTPRKIINAVIWSPGLFKSRLDIFNPGFYNKLEPAERILVARTLLNLVVTGGTVMGLVALAAKRYGVNAKVGYDPRSANFGKIKWGNTRFDVFGGNQQIARAAVQIITKEKINSSTGVLQHLGGGFGQTSQFDVGLNFLIGKESPVASLATAKLRGRGFDNQPFSWKKELSSWKMPLLWQDVSDVIHKDSGLDKAVTAAILGFFGVGIQSYGPPSSKRTRPASHRGSGGSWIAPSSPRRRSRSGGTSWIR